MKKNIQKRYEPINLDLESVLPKSEKKHLDRYGYLISYLYTARFLDNRWKDVSRISKITRKRKFIPLNAVIMRRILDKRHYRRILEYLSQKGIIEINNQYLVGKKSRSYRLNPKYADARYRTVEYSEKFSKRLETFQQSERIKKLSSLHKDIARQIELNFTVDMKLANKLMKKLKLKDSELTKAKLALDKIRTGDYGHTVGRRSGRYFNHITNLKKELRQAIVCKDGSELLEVDIANSQPFFLSFFLACLKRKESEVLRIAEEFKVKIPVLLNLALSNDFKHYETFSIQGNLYEYFCNVTKMEREEVKKKLILTLFKPMHYPIEFEQIFQSHFPSVFEIVKHLKPKKAHNQLAILLQRLESMTVIETMCEIMLSSELPFIPIHDAFLVPKKSAQYVAKHLQSVVYHYSRTKPTVRIKTLKGKRVKLRKVKKAVGDVLLFGSKV